MKMFIVCGNEDCRKEFSGETVEPYWKCPHCEREIENRHFPFLNAKLMEAKVHPQNAEWDVLFLMHLHIITDFVEQKTAVIKRSDPDFKIPEDYDIDDLLKVDGKTSFDQERFDQLLTRGHATAIYLIDVLKTKESGD